MEKVEILILKKVIELIKDIKTEFLCHQGKIDGAVAMLESIIENNERK